MFEKQIIPAGPEHMSTGRWVGEAVRAIARPLESDMMYFTFLKGHSVCFVGTEEDKGTRTEEGRPGQTRTQLCRDIQR